MLEKQHSGIMDEIDYVQDNNNDPITHLGFFPH